MNEAARAGFATASLYGELLFYVIFWRNSNNGRMDVTFKQIEIEVGFGLLSLNRACLCLICPLVVYHRVIRRACNRYHAVIL